MVDKTREIALKTLYKIDKDGAYSNIELNEEIRQNRKNLTEKDIGLISEITYGVTTWRLTLDEIIKKYSKIRLKKISPWILNILRMGIYQIIYLDDLKTLMKQLPSTHKNINITKALFEHNIYSLSRVFKNISFNSLEKFLKMKMDDIMTLCVKMINQGSIKAKIDQNSKFLLFEQEQGIATDFDEQIKNFCLKTKNLAEFINTN